MRWIDSGGRGKFGSLRGTPSVLCKLLSFCRRRSSRACRARSSSDGLEYSDVMLCRVKRKSVICTRHWGGRFAPPHRHPRELALEHSLIQSTQQPRLPLQVVQLASRRLQIPKAGHYSQE